MRWYPAQVLNPSFGGFEEHPRESRDWVRRMEKSSSLKLSTEPHAGGAPLLKPTDHLARHDTTRHEPFVVGPHIASKRMNCRDCIVGLLFAVSEVATASFEMDSLELTGSPRLSVVVDTLLRRGVENQQV